MTNVVQFPSGSRCAVCQSTKIVSTVCVVKNGEEITTYLCSAHSRPFDDKAISLADALRVSLSELARK